jgi:hypothetical protein
MYVRNIEVRLRNYCSRVKALSITYSVCACVLCMCVYVALVIQHAKRMRRIIWSVRLYHIFARYLTNGRFWGEKLLKIKCAFLFSLQTLI